MSVWVLMQVLVPELGTREAIDGDVTIHPD
jgi:hypothetical protein